MLLEHLSSLDQHEQRPDRVIVVGAGAVGVHLAVRLAKAGRQVLLLESGNRMIDAFPASTYEVVGRRHDGIGVGRTVALGGTTNLWGGQLVEFMPVDLEGRDWLPGSRWPVRFDELAPYYPPTYEALGIEPEMQTDDAVWKGIKKPPPEFVDGVEVFLTRWLKIPNVASHFVNEVETNPNLLVVLQTTAVGFHTNGPRISAIDVVDRAGERRTLEAGAVVLAAGTIENARLLLHAAADDSRDCPWRENDNIGRLFQDHLGGRLAYIKPRRAKAFRDAFCTVVLAGQKFQPKVRLRNEVLEKEPLLNCQAMIAFESSVSENLVFLKQFVKAAVYSRKVGSITDLVKNVFACSRHMVPLMWQYIVEHRILIPSGSRISLILQSEVEPQHESRIRIDPSGRDRYGLPKVLLDWRVSGRELQDVLAFTRRVEHALQDADLADLELVPELAAENPAFLDKLRDTNHQAGGCVMGASAEDGVVDADLRVFGTENLHVLGACVFRTCSNANTTFTAMAFATRLAEHLGDRDGHGAG